MADEKTPPAAPPTTAPLPERTERPRPPAGQRLGNINPQLPVVSKEDWERGGRRPFMVTNASQFKGRYGESWRIRVSDCENGDAYIILLGTSNAVRDDMMESIVAALNGSTMPVGPCVLAERKLATGRTTWELADAPEWTAGGMS